VVEVVLRCRFVRREEGRVPELEEYCLCAEVQRTENLDRGQTEEEGDSNNGRGERRTMNLNGASLQLQGRATKTMPRDATVNCCSPSTVLLGRPFTRRAPLLLRNLGTTRSACTCLPTLLAISTCTGHFHSHHNLILS
jgi:hypothetical protein